MSDCVAIAPELPFRQQVHDVVIHVSRSLEQNAAKDFRSKYNELTTVAEGEEISAERKQEVVRGLAGKVAELHGALDGGKDGDAESSHLLVQLLLADTLSESSDYAQLTQSIVESVYEGAKVASSGPTSRSEVAAKILSNTYNFLPPTSASRPTTLLALLRVLALSNNIDSLALSTQYLETNLKQWAASSSFDSGSFLTSASEVYQSAGRYSKALELQLLAGKYDSSSASERVIPLALAVEDKFDFSDVVGSSKPSGKVGELAALFTEVDELEAVSQGSQWVKENGPVIEGFGIKSLTPDAIVRKIRLIGLATLFARSQSKQVTYSEIASALSIPEADVEEWTVEAIRAGLVKVRLSQPTSTVRIISVSSAGTRRFGTDEWQLLEQRLKSWKSAVESARSAIDEALAVGPAGAQQSRGPNSNRVEQTA